MSGNGVPVIKIGNKGIRKFQIGDGPVFECDIVKVYNQWTEVQDQFLDKDRTVTDVRGFTEALCQMVKQLTGGVQDVSGAEAHEFLATLTEEQEFLRDFFDRGRRAKSSSRVPSEGSPASGSTPGQETSSGPASNRQQPGRYSTIQEVMPES